MAGKLIIVDGGEGSGTTTVSKWLVAELGEEATWTREPGGSHFSEKIRELILSEDGGKASAQTLFALFWAARADIIANTIAPALKEGKTVVCDRFDSSTYAYQVIAQEHIELADLFWRLREEYVGDIVSQYIILDVDAEAGLSRAKSRGDALTHFDKQKQDFHERVRQGFLDFAKAVDVPSTVIDAREPLEVVEQEVRNVI